MKEVSGSFLSNNDKFYEINRLNNSDVDYIHFDVMDGKFVSNKNITVSELPKLIDAAKKKIDIHFMVNDPGKYIDKICFYNIDYITIHYEIKNLEDYIDKIKAIVLIQIKIVVKYEDLITILLSQFWGNEARNQKCKKHILEYIKKIEQIVEEGIKKGQIKKGNPQAIASEIYGLICSSLVYKIRNNAEIDTMKLYKEFESTVIEGLKS